MVTAIKDNQPTMQADLRAMDFNGSPMCETLDKGHDRSDRRRYWIKDLSDSAWDGYAGLYGRRQTLSIERQRHVLKTGATSTEVTYVRDLPRNLACLTNTAISIVRCQSDFQYLPEANRYFAARPQALSTCS